MQKEKPTILIVDDEEVVRELAIYSLSNKGYRVLEAESAETALALLEREGNNVDLIMTDVVLPGMNAVEMAEKAKKQFPQIKFLFTSGYGETILPKKENEQYNFLPKPYGLQALTNKVEAVLNKE